MRLAWLGAGAMFLTSVLAGSGCQSPSSKSDAAKTTQAIQDGTIDSANAYRFAVGVCAGSGAVNSGNCFGICSGALILPNVVATARHCVDETPETIDCSLNGTFGQRSGGSFRVTTNNTMAGAATGWYGVQSVAVPDDDHICGNDIALLVLSSSIPSSVAKPITPGIQYLMWDPEQYEPAFYGIGFGNTSPAGGTAGTRRISLPISVQCVPGADVRDCPASLKMSPKDFIGGDGPCKGDSGSSAFELVHLNNGDPVSFGVLSRGGKNDDGTECLGSIYTRFDAHRDFVLAVAKAASNNWSLYPEPSWTAFKPPYTPKKDAGTSKDGSTPTTKPTGLSVGDACETADQCTSGLCQDGGDGNLICTSECEDSSTCPETYECRESLCLPPLASAKPASAPTTVTKSSCSSSPSTSSSASTGWACLGVAAVLVAGGRRRRNRRN